MSGLLRYPRYPRFIPSTFENAGTVAEALRYLNEENKKLRARVDELEEAASP